jgi:hypothetical protein
MPLAEGAILFPRCRESGLHSEEPEFLGPAQYVPCLQILKAMNRIMAEHFGIPPGQEKRLVRGRGEAEGGIGLVPASPHVPASELSPAVDPGAISTLCEIGLITPEGRCQHA